MVIYSWLLTAICLLAVVLNIKKKRACFFIWVGTNYLWALIDYQAGLHAQAALFIVYMALAIWGIHSWGKSGSAA